MFIRFVLGCVLLFSVNARAETLKSYPPGWEVGFLPNKGCYLTGYFDGGTVFWVALGIAGPVDHLTVSIGNRDWSGIEDQKEYRVQGFFGDESPWTLDMRGFTAGEEIYGVMFISSAGWEQIGVFLDELSREAGMEWYYENKKLGSYSLKGSSRAVAGLVDCQWAFRERYDQSTGDPFK